MEYKLKFFDKTYAVDIKNIDGGYKIAIEGKNYDIVEYSKYDNIITFKHNKKLYKIYFAQDKDTIYLVAEGDYYSLLIDQGRSVKSRGADVQQSDSVSSPMPGLLVKITVKIGEEVVQGTTLAIVEAMKMQNELRAPRDGIIKRINNHEGDQVEALKTIVELE